MTESESEEEMQIDSSLFEDNDSISAVGETDPDPLDLSDDYQEDEPIEGLNPVKNLRDKSKTAFKETKAIYDRLRGERLKKNSIKPKEHIKVTDESSKEKEDASEMNYDYKPEQELLQNSRSSIKLKKRVSDMTVDKAAAKREKNRIYMRQKRERLKNMLTPEQFQALKEKERKRRKERYLNKKKQVLAVDETSDKGDNSEETNVDVKPELELLENTEGSIKLKKQVTDSTLGKAAAKREKQRIYMRQKRERLAFREKERKRRRERYAKKHLSIMDGTSEKEDASEGTNIDVKPDLESLKNPESSIKLKKPVTYVRQDKAAAKREKNRIYMKQKRERLRLRGIQEKYLVLRKKETKRRKQERLLNAGITTDMTLDAAAAKRQYNKMYMRKKRAQHSGKTLKSDNRKKLKTVTSLQNKLYIYKAKMLKYLQDNNVSEDHIAIRMEALVQELTTAYWSQD